MIDSEKREFMATLQTTGQLYDKTIAPERVVLYWHALKHRSLAEIKAAINAHVQTPGSGRFFPLPADIAAALPAESVAWLSADEAWAMVPKDESSSTTLCSEIAESYAVASDLMTFGDHIAARRAFIDAYNRRVEEAKRMGRKPVWWPSYGHEKTGRHIADVEVVKMQNLALPADQRKALPTPATTNDAPSIARLAATAPTEKARESVEMLKRLVGRK